MAATHVRDFERRNGSETKQESEMRGIDQSSRQLALAIVLVSGASLLVPTAAAAQFNIPNIPFISPFGGYRSGHSSSRHIKPSKPAPSKQEATDSDTSSDQNGKNDGKPPRKQTSAPAVDTSQPLNDPPGKVVPSKSTGDEPSFSPSR
jgi:hypothetical protein